MLDLYTKSMHGVMVISTDRHCILWSPIRHSHRYIGLLLEYFHILPFLTRKHPARLRIAKRQNPAIPYIHSLQQRIRRSFYFLSMRRRRCFCCFCCTISANKKITLYKSKSIVDACKYTIHIWCIVLPFPSTILKLRAFNLVATYIF